MRRYILSYFHNPILCKRINVKKNPWGWKCNNDIMKVISYKTSNHNISFDNYELKFIHEYRLKEYCEDFYLKTYHSYINKYDFLNSDLFSPNLALGLNYLRSESDVSNLESEINIKNITILSSWIKYGRVKNINKYLGYYNLNEIMHELSAGIIGPEIRSIWDQNGVKQKVRLLIKSDSREDVFDFERDLMTLNNNWQLCNINRIILN